MAWIESHQELLGHPKTLRLAAELKCSVPTAIGYLHILWWWALDYAPDGRVAATDRNIVAQACQWRGKPERFWEALVAAGFIEEGDERGLKIHDWMDYAGRLLEKRAAHAARTERARSARVARSERAADAQEARNGPATGALTVPYRTVPNQPDPTSPPVPPPTSTSADALKSGAHAPCCPLFELTERSDYVRHSDYCPTRVPEIARA